jgi:plastocyanin
MRKTGTILALLAASSIASLYFGSSATPPLAADDNNRKIAIRDDCDPRDPGWTPSGGCTLEEGDVSLMEFGVEVANPAAASVIGHQAWRNDPNYLKIREGQSVRVRNRGGRAHTLTEVPNFQAGKILANAALNRGLAPAVECLASTNLDPGAGVTIRNLQEGNHRFQCCIHPWMRAIIKVKPAGHDDDEEDEDN